MEVVFAVALFSAFAVVSILAFTTFNRFASDARYETLALALAQQRMDQIMTSPCVVNTSSSLGPILTLSGTTISPNGSGTATTYTSLVESATLPLNADPYNSTRTINSGSNLTITLSGTMTAAADETELLDSRTTTFAAVISGTTMNPRQLSVGVTVNYTYRGRPFAITLRSLRATDNF